MHNPSAALQYQLATSNNQIINMYIIQFLLLCAICVGGRFFGLAKCVVYGTIGAVATKRLQLTKLLVRSLARLAICKLQREDKWKGLLQADTFVIYDNLTLEHILQLRAAKWLASWQLNPFDQTLARSVHVVAAQLVANTNSLLVSVHFQYSPFQLNIELNITSAMGSFICWKLLQNSLRKM